MTGTLLSRAIWYFDSCLVKTAGEFGHTAENPSTGIWRWSEVKNWLCKGCLCAPRLNSAQSPSHCPLPCTCSFPSNIVLSPSAKPQTFTSLIRTRPSKRSHLRGSLPFNKAVFEVLSLRRRLPMFTTPRLNASSWGKCDERDMKLEA